MTTSRTNLVNSDLSPFLRARSIAIIGASDNPGRVGGMPLRFLRQAGYDGAVFPVNPQRDTVQGEPCFASIGEIAEPVELALVAVSADRVIDAVKECAAAGVRAAIVLSAGFAEADDIGRRRQEQLEELSAHTGIRICGPNCAGVMSIPNKLTASFGSHLAADISMPEGSISVVSQSGAVGAYLFSLARRLNVGLSKWVTTGNEVDVTVADFVHELAHDDDTRVIVIYLEQVRKVETLMEACAVAHARGKRIVGILAGRTAAAEQALQSHTASLVGDRDVAVAGLEQMGVVLVESIDDLLSAAVALDQPRHPQSSGLGLISISGAAGIMMVDAASRNGLDVPTLPAAVQERMRSLVPFAGTSNPVDVTGNISNQPEAFPAFLDELIGDDRIGALVCFLGHVLLSPHVGDRLRRDVIAAAARTSKPIWLVGLVADTAAADELRAAGVALVTDPVECIDMLALSLRAGDAVDDVLRRRAEQAESITVPAGQLSEVAAQEVLRMGGIRFPAQVVVQSPAEAEAAIASMGLDSVVMKIVSPDIQHKSDIGGVQVGVRRERVAAAYGEIVAAAAAHVPHAQVDGVLLQEIAQGHPVIVGSKLDADFGPVVMVGSGGVYTELLRDRAIALGPVTVKQADELIERTGLPKFLAGARGGAPLARDQLARLIADVSELAWKTRDHISTLELNPVLVGETAVVAVDALIETKGTVK